MSLIELKIKRKNGSKVQIDGAIYHFKDDGKGKHVAEVSNQEHVKKLLAIPQYVLASVQAVDDEPTTGDENLVDGFSDDDVISIDDDELDAVDDEPEEQQKPVAKKTTARKTASK